MRLPSGFRGAITALSRLPGVGERTAQRLTFFLLDHPEVGAEIAAAMGALSEGVCLCAECRGLAEGRPGEALCSICADPGRQPTLICVVETIPHLLAIEGSESFEGRYHVLHGALSPIKGVGPDELCIPALVARVERDSVEEVIVATDVDVEGEATAAYLCQALARLPVRVSRIASGVPMGSDLEYLDPTTLSRALRGRRLRK